jgi:hypothetical protein
MRAPNNGPVGERIAILTSGQPPAAKLRNPAHRPLPRQRGPGGYRQEILLKKIRSILIIGKD